MHIDKPMIERFKELSIGYLTGSLSEQETDEYVRLYRSSPEYVKIYVEIERAYTSGLVIRYEGEKAINFAIVQARIAKTSKRKKVFAIVASVAAAVVACILNVNYLWGEQETLIQHSDILCRQVEEDTNIILPDGSWVWVKAGSSLSYDPDKFESERTVILDGEACFDVRHDMYHPFIVRTESVSVKVLGTVFNVNTRKEYKAIETTLARGSVVIQDVQGEDILFVHPGQQVVFENRENFKVNELRAWEYLLERYGTVTIPDAPMSEIVEVLERVYGVKIAVDIPPSVCPIVTFGFNKGDDCKEVIERLRIISGCGVSVSK